MANEAQREYWNSAPGRKWVTNQATLDRSLEEVAALLFERAALRPGERVLDVGCGTGETLLQAARRVGPEGSVLGIDISEPLLALARERLSAAQAGNVQLLNADAQTHSFAPASFDAVYSRFGVMFFEEPKRAFRNLRQALKPGGRLCFVCWGPLDDNPWFKVPLNAAVRRLGPPDPQPLHAPGPMAFSDPDYVGEILRSAGFRGTAIDVEHPRLIGHGSAEEEAAFATVVGPLARLVRERQPDAATLADITGEVAKAFQAYAGDVGVRVPTTVYCVRASVA